MVYAEARKRGFNFNAQKIGQERATETIPVTTGQVKFEFKHLLGKLKELAPEKYELLKGRTTIALHPLFERVTGDIASWEKGHR